jgi:putative endonuclease
MTREPPDRKRLKALRRGSLAEYRAALSLLMKGYRIVAFRYRTKLGEIDIIARKGNLIDSVYAVSDLSQRRIRAASDLWLAKQPDFVLLSVRYDIISVVAWRWPIHLPDAF